MNQNTESGKQLRRRAAILSHRRPAAAVQAMREWRLLNPERAHQQSSDQNRRTTEAARMLYGRQEFDRLIATLAHSPVRQDGEAGKHIRLRITDHRAAVLREYLLAVDKLIT